MVRSDGQLGRLNRVQAETVRELEVLDTDMSNLMNILSDIAQTAVLAQPHLDAISVCCG